MAAEKKANGADAADYREVQLTSEEQEQVNAATAAIHAARETLGNIWGPIRERYALPREAFYQRETGLVRVESSDG